MPKASMTDILFGKKSKTSKATAVKKGTTKAGTTAKAAAGKPTETKTSTVKPATSAAKPALPQKAPAAKPVGSQKVSQIKPEEPLTDPNTVLTDRDAAANQKTEVVKESPKETLPADNPKAIEIRQQISRAEKVLRLSNEEMLAQAIRSMLHKDGGF